MRLTAQEDFADRPVRVLVADEERVFADCLARGLTGNAGTDAARTASSALEALHLLQLATPDVVVLGTHAGDWQTSFLRAATRHAPEVPVVVLVEPDASADHLAALVTAGARGIASTDDSLAHLTHVVLQVRAGQWWLPRELLGRVVRTLSTAAEDVAADRLARLTFRERQVLAAMAEGLPRSEIGARLHLSVNTVRTHVQHLLAKLEVHTSLEAVALALQEGLGLPGGQPGTFRAAP